ncbi:AAA family ATPase [Methyloceanibacter stevinii]|uniref:bifunctional aminoglycoside phosphotransferase/ATP-binding protein n=1 Tax=Methyloceanibacter stevinii TaxID=1774970 RepID=UPI00084988DE|nr:bifunctional aminoglycoside phosphotransferase/ATP-binding protein [Methyloceanibacter stevinii]
MEQAKVIEFLSRPGTYDPAPAAVDRIETHASFVFLAGAFAYKIKREVKLPFLDFSTLQKRHQACLNEPRLNRRTAPDIYREVVPVTVDASGRLALRGQGEPVEWVLVMRRFGQENLFDRMAREGRLSLDAMHRTALAVAALHDAADRILTADQAVVPLEKIISEHEHVLQQAAGDVIPQAAADSLARRTRTAFERLKPLLMRRAATGFVRHCHGDLHLRNIVEIEGDPVLFDALEFDDSLATIDVLYDLAFLLMDLGKHGLGAYANAVLNGYLDNSDTGNLLGLAALPLFLSLRAVIRGKVELLRSQLAEPSQAKAARDEARDYFELALQFLEPEARRLIAVGGLSGTGKSTIARAMAPRIGAFPGRGHVRSDLERKRLFGVAPTDRLSATAYTQYVSDLVYVLCRKRAALVLEAGKWVIVDAVHARPHEREAIAAVAAEHGVPFTGLWFDAPGDVLEERVADRVGDVSDATPEVVREQLRYDLGEIGFARIDAGGSVEQVAERCLNRLKAESGSP